MFRLILAFILGVATALPAAAQSTAINGSIEGVVTDESGAVLPGVTVTVANLDTGDTRVVVTSESGLYRAPLLPLGRYRVTAELQGFKKFEQTGINISAGQTAVISVKMGVGELSETISVTADAPLVDLSRIEGGRTLTEAEIKTLPLTSRNPYNFALLQPGVVGFENQEFGVPRITSNGALLRVNYQIDGSNNTQKDRAGLRQMPMSEVMIREVKVVTTGYAPEFGQTMGLIYNAITPSGTNTYRGQGSYRFQRKSMAAFPFFTQGVRNDDTKPPTDVNIYTGGHRRADRPQPHPLLRRLRAHRARPLGRRGHHHHAGQPGGARPERAALPAARPQHRVRHRQDRPPAQRQQPGLGALHLLRQLHHRQRRRRPPVDRARHRLHRPPALDGGAVRLDDPHQPAERAARAVRDARAGPHAGRAGRHRPGHQRHQRGEVRRPDRQPHRRRLRLHAGRRRR